MHFSPELLVLCFSRVVFDLAAQSRGLVLQIGCVAQSRGLDGWISPGV